MTKPGQFRPELRFTSTNMTKKSTPRRKRARRSLYLMPWLVTQRDFVRYRSRALRACLAGRVLLFLHWNKEMGTTALLALVRVPGEQAALAAALKSFDSGRVKKVRLQDLPAIRKDAQCRRRLGDIDAVTYATGLACFGSEAALVKWLCAPARALNGKVPLQLLGTAKGRGTVTNVLLAIQHGVFL